MRAIAFGLAVGFGAAVVRGGPAIEYGSWVGLWLLFVLGLIAAYLGGRRHRGGSVAVASATSIAEASASASAQGGSVNVFVAPHDFGAVRASRWQGEHSTPDHLGEPVSALQLVGDLGDDLDPIEVLEADRRGELIVED